MTTVHLQPLVASSFASFIPRRLNLAVKAALLGLFAAPLPGHADEPSKQAVFPEILVQARQDDVRKPGTRTVITSEELERRNVTGLAGLVRYEPLISAPISASGSGSVWDSSGNSGYNIRGIEGNRVSLDIDGISLPDAAPKPDATSLNSFGIGREYFDPETFHEVRIGSGTSPAGAATPGLGGSVAFITKSPEDFLGNGRDSYVSYKLGYTAADRAAANTLTGAARVGNLQALAVLVHRKGSETKSLGDSPLNPDNWSSNAILTKLVWALPGDQKIDFTIDAYERDNKRVYLNKQSAAYPDGASQDSTTRRNRFSLGHTIAVKDVALFDTLTSKIYMQNSRVEDQTTAHYITGRVRYDRLINTGYFNNSYGVTSEAFKQVNAGNALTYGVSAEQTSTRRPWLEDRTVISTGAHQITMKNRMADMDTTKVAVFVRDELGFGLGGYKATLTPGLRAEYRSLKPKNLDQYLIAVPGAAKEIKEESDTYLTPGLGLSVEVAPNLDLYGQYSRGTRLPTAAERTGTYDSFSYTGAGNGYAVLGNPNLQKETSNAFELGLKGTATKGLTFRSALFYTKYNNFIDYQAQPADPVNYPTITFGLFRPENIGNARTWGGEVSARAELGSWSPAMQGWYVDAAAGLTRGSSQDKLTGISTPLASVAPYKGTFSIGYDHASQLFGIDLTAVKVGAKQAPDQSVNGVVTPNFAVPGYTLFDLSTYWNVHKNAKLVFGVYNLGNRKYWDYASSRSLVADTGGASHSDIQRQAMAGRNVAASLTVSF
ncbi:TonB-dependent hemoglobin/transferrin/lactoferrin family receptor [Janthinobacterium agaricidamnosum]|uniref:TonB-dependent Receptor Plug domain protein n=1 Tax=Janthinobacterium agaricidamnosum NBRC 102515 = DSM 9628 TaxID=1349767 RepID=W0V2B4_9BURK|nr:TonB-dependent hemoglobin/transferrin/lactoferrin family receptor [Janthinobacterium agaricidamnosum]CDG82944.1 tonB-dependent Receptor Plug domain protein [Janthinobacterium agaricidamnosum NBRC 102515 = DSM 9628]